MEKEIDDSKENPVEGSMEESEEKPIENSTEELTEELTEEPAEELTKKPIKNLMKEHKKIIIGIIISLCILLIIYFGMVKYFTNHFYFGTEINGTYVSGRTLEEVEKIMKSELENYTLTLKHRGDKTEQIKADDVNLRYSSEEAFQKFKESQNPFRWFLSIFTRENSKLSVPYSYDRKQLKKQIDQFSCFDSKNIIEPKNPTFQYVNNRYVIIDEVQGNKINKGVLYSRVADAIRSGKTKMDLESEGCYIKPKYHATSPKTIKARDILNTYISSKITYIFGDHKETIDGSIINKWLVVNGDLEVTIDENKVENYIDTFSQTYNTVGKTRDFVTSSGKTIKVGGGDYGWAINKEKEVQNLLSFIKEGKKRTKKPEYSQRAFSCENNDIGNTYVEIDLTNQHMWFYKNGVLVTQGDVVTGNVSRNHTTPKGIYRLKYKIRNAVLRGPGYASPVSFWMPFNGGIGIHDANWRNTFGGNIYKTNGSHGCINSPYNVAKKIFNNIESGTPVICYE